MNEDKSTFLKGLLPFAFIKKKGYVLPERSEGEKKLGKIKYGRYEKMYLTVFLIFKNQHFVIFIPTNYH